MRDDIESPKRSVFDDLFSYLFEFIAYLIIRLKQVFFYTIAFIIFVIYFLEDIKQALVRRMFWGRSVFYRSAFQFSVGILTIIVALGGLAGRLNLFGGKGSGVLAFPQEHLGDADFLDEKSSLQAIVTESANALGYSVETYIVQKGDSIGSIADRFGVSTDTIRWANGITGDYIKVGQQLQIPPINGVLHTVKAGDTIDSLAKKYSASVQDIYDINWLDSTMLKVGQVLLVPNGRMPQPPKPIPVVASTKPGGTYTPPPGSVKGGTGSMVWPVNAGCGHVTNYFKASHPAVDIAGSGCTNLAADGGVVTLAKWMPKGGLQVEIDHGNGFKTLYAHNASLYVSVGQTVTKGQPIGTMGATGHASGVHLHFGISLNGYWVNPLSYVSPR